MSQPVHEIHHPIFIDAGIGRTGVETDYARHVEQMIRQVLFTSPGERINRPGFGAGLRRQLFGPLSPQLATLTETLVRQALEEWLAAFLRVDEVRTEAARDTLHVAIVYTLLKRNERRYLNVEVTL